MAKKIIAIVLVLILIGSLAWMFVENYTHVKTKEVDLPFGAILCVDSTYDVHGELLDVNYRIEEIES